MIVGIGIFFGLIGGFIVGFIFNVLFIGWLFEKIKFIVFYVIVVNILGVIVMLIFGVLWFKVSIGFDWLIVFLIGMVFFIILGIIKVVFVVLLGIFICDCLIKVKLF